MPPDTKSTTNASSQGVCRCQATIAASVLDGYACGNPDCWRTAVAKASFDAFVADLIRRRGDVVPPSPEVT